MAYIEMLSALSGEAETDCSHSRLSAVTVLLSFKTPPLTPLEEEDNAVYLTLRLCLQRAFTPRYYSLLQLLRLRFCFMVIIHSNSHRGRPQQLSGANLTSKGNATDSKQPNSARKFESSAVIRKYMDRTEAYQL